MIHIKRKFFFNAIDLGRFLDPFEDAEYALGIGGLLDHMTIRNAGHASVLRHSSGEHENDEAGTSI